MDSASTPYRNDKQFRTAKLIVTTNGFEKALSDRKFLLKFKPESYSEECRKANLVTLYLYLREKYLYAKSFNDFFGRHLSYIATAGRCPTFIDSNNRLSARIQEFELESKTNQEGDEMEKLIKNRRTNELEAIECPNNYTMKIENNDLMIPIQIKPELMNKFLQEPVLGPKYKEIYQQLSQRERTFQRILLAQFEIKKKCKEILELIESPAQKDVRMSKGIISLLDLIKCEVKRYNDDRSDLRTKLEAKISENNTLKSELEKKNSDIDEEGIKQLLIKVNSMAKKLKKKIEQFSQPIEMPVLKKENNMICKVQKLCEYMFDCSDSLSIEMGKLNEKHSEMEIKTKELESETKKWKQEKENLSQLLRECEGRQLPAEKIWNYLEKKVKYHNIEFLRPEKIWNETVSENGQRCTLHPCRIGNKFYLVVYYFDKTKKNFIFVPEKFRQFEEEDLLNSSHLSTSHVTKIIVPSTTDIDTALIVAFCSDQFIKCEVEFHRPHQKSKRIQSVSDDTWSTICFNIFASLSGL